VVGNDIVDIDFCEPPALQHVRHLDRVCTPEEALGVRRSVDPVKALAVMWSAKEATYKLLSKQLPRCRFVPRQFVTQIENLDPVQIDRKLTILYAGMQIEVSICVKDKWVNAVASAPSTIVHWKVSEIERCFLNGRKASSESKAVRFLAKALLNEVGLNDVSLQFDGRVPKLRRKAGEPAGMDVSLAHHGAFVAAAIAWPVGGLASQPVHDAGFTGAKSSEAVCSTCTV